MAILLDFYFRENRPEKCVLNQKKVFYDILDDRNAFLDYKNKKLKQSKKLVIFPHFYFRENRPEECVLNQKSVVYDIVQGRNAFLDYRNKNLKKSKN